MSLLPLVAIVNCEGLTSTENELPIEAPVKYLATDGLILMLAVNLPIYGLPNSSSTENA